MEIIRITETDDKTLNQIVEIEQQAYNGQGNVDLWIIKALIRYGLVFLLKDGDRIINIIEYLRLFDENSVFLYGIATIKDERNKGHSKQMIEYTEKYLKGRNINKILLTVDPENKIAIDLYKKLGYSIDSFEKNEYGENVDRYIMSKNI